MEEKGETGAFAPGNGQEGVDASLQLQARGAADRARSGFSRPQLADLTELAADWLWEADSALRLTWISDGFGALTGVDPRRLVGQARLDLMKPVAGRGGDIDAHLGALAARRPFRDHLFELPDDSGGRRLISVSGMPWFDEAGGFAGYRGFGRDVTHLASLADELAAERRNPDLRESRDGALRDRFDGEGHLTRLLAALDVTREAFACYDAEDRLVLYNQALIDMYSGLEDLIRPGVTFQALVEQGLKRGLWQADGMSGEEWGDRLTEMRRGGKEAECVIAFRDGRFVFHRERRTEDGGTVAVCTDITALKRHEIESEEARAQAEAALDDLRRTVDSMRIGVVLLEEDLTAVIVNQAYRTLCEFAPGEEPVGLHMRQLLEACRRNGYYSMSDDEWEEYVDRRLAEIRVGESAPRELVRSDGRTMICTLTSLSRGRRLLTCYDVTDLKQREKELAAALDRAKLAQAVIDRLPSPIFVKDADLRFVLVNEAFARMYETDPYSMIGKKGADYGPPEAAAFFEESERRVLETGEDHQAEEDFDFSGIGRSRIVRKHRVRIADGKEYVACTIFDVTDLKQRETDAEETRARLAHVLETLPAGVIIYDREDRFVLANRNVHDALPAMSPAMQPGRPLREAVELAHDAGYFRDSGDPDLDRLYDTDREAWIDGYVRRYRERHHVFERRNPDGRWYKVFDTRREDGTFVGVRVDITELKERESQLEESMRENEIFRNLVDNVPVAIYAKRPDLKLMYVNKGWSDLVGFPRDEAIGKTDLEIFGPEGEAFMEADRTVLRSGSRVEMEETRTIEDGSVRHQIARKDAMVASDGSLYLIGSTSDVTELKRREEELKIAREKAVAADRAKSEFLANMSHEIRTPMNGVLGMAELLAKTELSSKQKTFIDIIVKSGNALLTIINDILDFSKINAGQLVLDPQPFKLAEAVEDVATLISSRAREKDLEMIVRIDPTLPEAFVGDVGRIRQIVTNLLGNAVKFTDNGHVLVDVTGETADGQTRLEVRVSDTGIGIPKEKLDLIFDKFSQVDTSSTRRHEGTGLGLAITSRLVALMGGEIGVESEEGKGSTFWFTMALPIGETAMQTRAAPRDVTGARVLIVDDNAINRTILAEQMVHWGFDACAANNAEEGLKVLETAARLGIGVDCAVIDYQMPGMSGIDLTRAIRSSPAIAQTPVILLSSVDQSLSTAGSSELAIDAQLLKPARATNLLEAMVLTIQRRRAGVAGDPPAAERPAAPARAEEAAEGQGVQSFLPAAGPRSTETDHGVDILVAEDNEVNQLVFSQILSESALRFEIVNNGREAVQAYRRLAPRLVLMDVSMPEMNGLEATAEIRRMETDGGRHIPIIGVTAHALKGDRERCMEAGMDDYLSKPISPKALMDKIGRWSAGQKPARIAIA